MTLDLLALIPIGAAVALIIAVVVKTAPGSAIRLLGGEHTGHHVRPAGTPREPHAKPMVRHAAPRWDRPALAAAETATTIPDALNVRTAA